MFFCRKLANTTNLLTKKLNDFPPSQKDLRAESAKAVTGRRCPYSGEGEDFLTGRDGTENYHNSGMKSREKNGQISKFWGQKTHFFIPSG